MKKALRMFGTQNRWLCVITIAMVTCLLFCSCQSSPVVWDNSYPEETLAIVRFFDMNIVSYNGINVSKFRSVKIPAGQTELSGDVNIYHAGVRFAAKGMEFSYQFEANREYRIEGSSNEMLWGISVYEGKTLLAFVPFKEQPKFTN
ncbi:MAG: hypothetical protein FWD36_08270 [Treponema sp.]|nr:hypothetical protein [Treponema sp.]